jgi:hypothetical protein
LDAHGGGFLTSKDGYVMIALFDAALKRDLLRETL